MLIETTHSQIYQQVAKMWGLGVDIIRRIFENLGGVVKIVSPERLHKRRYTILRIPVSVLRRVHRRSFRALQRRRRPDCIFSELSCRSEAFLLTIPCRGNFEL